MSLNHKSDLRAAALSRRDALPADEREAAAVRAASWASTIFRDDKVSLVSGYWPIRSEIDPRPLLAQARVHGLSVALPVLVDAETLLFRLWDPADPLEPAGFGTMGPPQTAPFVVPDLVVMPLAAFDRRLHRIGYGKGHYDRAIGAMLSAGKRPLLVGLAFAVQEVENVPFEPHDIPLDFIATEDELIAAPA